MPAFHTLRHLAVCTRPAWQHIPPSGLRVLADTTLFDARQLVRMILTRPYSSNTNVSINKGSSSSSITTSSKKAAIKHVHDAHGKTRVVVLGSGWGALSAVKKLDKGLFDITVISPRNYFVFTPLLASTTVGTLEFRNVVEPMRNATPSGVHYIMGSATSIDPEHRTLSLSTPHDTQVVVPYDKLVLSVGALSNTFGVPGVEEHAFFLKDASHARAIRTRILECFEAATNPETTPEERKRLLSFVIVGGGPTGVEFCGELGDFVRSEVPRKYPELDPAEIQISLFEASQILSSFDSGLREYTMSSFRQHRVNLRVGVGVTQVREHDLVTSEGDVLPHGLVIWSTGLAPTPFVQSLPFPRDEKTGRLWTDQFCRIPQQPDIYAIGDCATTEGSPLPPTAQAASQEGKYVAKSLNALQVGNEVRQFAFHNAGMLAYIGGYRALADIPNVKGRGFFAWLFWRSAYLTTLVSWRNKIAVAVNWAVTFVFGRDISQF